MDRCQIDCSCKTPKQTMITVIEKGYLAFEIETIKFLFK